MSLFSAGALLPWHHRLRLSHSLMSLLIAPVHLSSTIRSRASCLCHDPLCEHTLPGEQSTTEGTSHVDGTAKRPTSFGVRSTARDYTPPPSTLIPKNGERRPHTMQLFERRARRHHSPYTANRPQQHTHTNARHPDTPHDTPTHQFWDIGSGSRRGERSHTIGHTPPACSCCGHRRCRASTTRVRISSRKRSCFSKVLNAKIVLNRTKKCVLNSE